MTNVTLLQKYGFEQAADGLWTIKRQHTATTDGQSQPLEKVRVEDTNVTFHQMDDGRWRFTGEDGGKTFLTFETYDVRDVIAFAQTIIASTIFEVSGYPLDEGFEFEGMHYTSPFMFGPYYDFETVQIGDEVWAKHPEGKYGVAYRRWRDDFADRVLTGQAAAPEEYHETAPAAAAKPGY
ncbi:hypothetical protein OIU34_20650 [Pararhizobium sp. BT-229]|uniref:hypothetical protein n=1 Tax=Pararhizobium sp. BT-229 TaxID=2986923 RepID=UPI0021F73270|nr:hypothetical protein [Pararhizobium sp. BT-229]MCV9964300.1 hypothetical protein [Pararhizobium sp. BT-229]